MPYLDQVNGVMRFVHRMHVEELIFIVKGERGSSPVDVIFVDIDVAAICDWPPGVRHAGLPWQNLVDTVSECMHTLQCFIATRWRELEQG